MNKYAILVASDDKVLSQVKYSFSECLDVIAWATDPNEWEIYEAGYVDNNGFTFEDAIDDYVWNEAEIPVAVAYLKPDELEGQVIYPIYKRNEIYVVGDNHGD